MAQGNRIFYAIPGKRISVYIDPDDGHIYQNNFGNALSEITKYDIGHIRNFVNGLNIKNNPFIRNLSSKVEPNLKYVENTLLKREQQKRDALPADGNLDTAEAVSYKPKRPKRPKRPRGTGGGTQTTPQTPTYNYNFGQYYTDNPNGDKSKPIANNYFNADQYSTRQKAFEAAQKAGHGVFTWRGKAYNTMNKGDDPLEFRRKHSDYDAFIGNAHIENGDDGIDHSGGWSKNYNRDNVFNNQQINPITADQANNNTLVNYTPKPQVTQQQTPAKLGFFGMNDVISLGFNNYSGMLSAINNQANEKNPFIIAMKDRYGSDTSKWDQNKIENDLRIKGKYRGRLLGDFKDMYTNMADWALDRNNRTGSNGTVYSTKEMKDAFESHNPNRQQSTQTSTAGTTNTSATTGTTSTTPSNTSYTPNKYSWQSNTKNNTSQFNTDLSPYLNMGYAMQHQKLQKGGTINMEEQQLQQAFLQYLMQKTGAKDQQQLEQVIQQLGEDGLKQAYSQFLQEMQQQQVQAAKFGAKLNYIRHLNGQCPDGTEMTYFKVGGKLCKKCMQRQQKEQEAEEPSDPIKAFKCGRKMKRK